MSRINLSETEDLNSFNNDRTLALSIEILEKKINTTLNIVQDILVELKRFQLKLAKEALEVGKNGRNKL